MSLLAAGWAIGVSKTPDPQPAIDPVQSARWVAYLALAAEPAIAADAEADAGVDLD